MVNYIPVSCHNYLERDEVCPIIQTYPAMYPEGETGPGINEYPVELCLKCGQSFIKTDEPFCLHCHDPLSKQGAFHAGATPKGSYHVYSYKCDRCGLHYYSHHELF
jgi:hypothetical protein